MNKIFKISLYLTLFILIIILFIAPTIWCYNPSILLNTKYDIISDLKIEDIDEPSLFICTHDFFPKYDQIIMLTEILKNKRKFNVVSAVNNNIYDFLKNLPPFPKYDLLKVGKNKANLVEKSKNLLKEKKENVLIFLTGKTKRKGIYYILKDLKVPLIFIRILEKDDSNNKPIIFGKKFKIEYEKIKDYEVDEDPEKFMEFVKGKLYL